MYLDAYEGDPAYEGKMVLDVVFEDAQEFESFTPPDWCRPDPTEGILSEKLALGGRSVELLQGSASLPEEIVLFQSK